MAENPEPVVPSDQPQNHPATAHHYWARATMWVVMVAIFFGSALFVFKSCRDLPQDVVSSTGKSIERAGHALSGLAAALKRGTVVTTSFVSYATSLSNHQYLQFSTLRQTEIFSRTESPITAFGYFALPEVVVEARAPVEYTYFLDLNDKWELLLQDNILYVFPPRIRYNKPAVDASAINYEVRRGYVKSAEVQANLKNSLSDLVQLRAKENIPLIRESARKQTSDFVEKWLAKNFTDGQRYGVKVYFPDEPRPNEIKLMEETKK